MLLFRVLSFRAQHPQRSRFYSICFFFLKRSFKTEKKKLIYYKASRRSCLSLKRVALLHALFANCLTLSGLDGFSRHIKRPRDQETFNSCILPRDQSIFMLFSSLSFWLLIRLKTKDPLVVDRVLSIFSRNQLNPTQQSGSSNLPPCASQLSSPVVSFTLHGLTLAASHKCG